MRSYIITYELSHDNDYSGFFSAIKEYGTWARITENAWAVETEEKAKQIRDNLSQFIYEGDRLFIVKSGGEAAWRNSRAKNDWLRKHL